MVVYHRRQLLASLRDRAERAESEARLRAEQARMQAREEIAREIHDVLGHRLSLLSVHAGALRVRPDAPPQDIARAAEIIREAAHLALEDLRELVGVLRVPSGLRPHPTLGDIGQLVAESSRAGTRVKFTEDVAGSVPDTLGRTAYRIVQEGLTNVRRHAPGADVEVRVSGAPNTGLEIEVRNSKAQQAQRPASPAGHGLIGLAERVALAHGDLEYGPDGDGWRLVARLPWPS